ncbi:hypothetical protein KP509_36G001900 [Ceratopteris richardii]|nr:hypothetical protein KP509_36G001900 [Ceratopteris richardii]
MYPEASSYGKSGGKYLPYSNVDSFLKVCQELGLTAVDLFSPPDVVEKKDIRRVCLCIRALSKKARARQLEVPEFDSVTHASVSMPTEFVGGLKNTLTQASANSSPSSLLKDKEMLEKVGPGPLRLRKSASASSLVQADSSLSGLPDEGSKETARSLNFSANDDTGNVSQHHSAIDPGTPPVAGNSESLPLSDDDRGHTENSFDDKYIDTCVPVGDPLPEVPSNDLFPKALCEDNPSVELGSVNKSADKNGKRKSASRKTTWIVPFLGAAVVLLGASIMAKPRESLIYEVKKGDTLSEISRRTGKSSWQELVLLNPEIKNPDLIHPSERLRLKS